MNQRYECLMGIPRGEYTAKPHLPGKCVSRKTNGPPEKVSYDYICRHPQPTAKNQPILDRVFTPINGFNDVRFPADKIGNDPNKK